MVDPGVTLDRFPAIESLQMSQGSDTNVHVQVYIYLLAFIHSLEVHPQNVHAVISDRSLVDEYICQLEVPWLFSRKYVDQDMS